MEVASRRFGYSFLGSGTIRHQPFGRQYGVGHMGDNMASVTKVSTKWVDQIDKLTDIFEEVSIFGVWLSRFAPFAK